jgi:hypothetical protein
VPEGGKYGGRSGEEHGSKRDGVRQLYLLRLEDKKERRLTDLAKGRAAMWPHWQPAANKP